MSLQSIRFVNPERRRWYRLDYGHDLTGDLVLIRRWGGLDSARGGESVSVMNSLEELNDALDQLCRLRPKRGYSRS